MTKFHKSPIASLRARCLSFPIVVPFSIALESLPEAEIVIITAEDSEGRCGIGEAAPFPKLTYDTVSVVMDVLGSELKKFEGQDPTAALAALHASASEWRKHSVSAFCGLESALFDLIAKQQGMSLAKLHGNAAIADIETDITLPIMPLSGVPEFHQLFSKHDFRTIKVKVSGNVSHDADLVRTVVELFPDVTHITLDGNQGFNVESAAQLVSQLALAGIRPQFFEQPLPEQDWAGTSALAARMEVPICLDEAVRTVADLQKVIEQRLPVMINLKIMKSGVAQSAHLIDLAKAHGIAMMIGGMLESPVAMGHSLHLACGRGGVSFFDLDTPFFFKDVPTGESPWSRRKASLMCPEGPGLGIALTSDFNT